MLRTREMVRTKDIAMLRTREISFVERHSMTAPRTNELRNN